MFHICIWYYFLSYIFAGLEQNERHAIKAKLPGGKCPLTLISMTDKERKLFMTQFKTYSKKNNKIKTMKQYTRSSKARTALRSGQVYYEASE